VRSSLQHSRKIQAKIYESHQSPGRCSHDNRNRKNQRTGVCVDVTEDVDVSVEEAVFEPVEVAVCAAGRRHTVTNNVGRNIKR